MFTSFANPEQLIKIDTPDRLILGRANRLRLWGAVSLLLALISLGATLAVGLNPIGGSIAALYAGLGLWLVISKRTIIFDASQQALFFSTRYLFFEHKRQAVHFAEIKAVYLDFEEFAYPGLKNLVQTQDRIWRKWYIFLTLTSTETVTVAYRQQTYPVEQAPPVSKQTVAWESLANKICAITGSLLVRTASVPGQAPRTFVEIIDQIVQRRLAALPPTDALAQQTIRLRSHPTGRLEFIINGALYRELREITDARVRNFIQAAVDEWHGEGSDE